MRLLAFDIRPMESARAIGCLRGGVPIFRLEASERDYVLRLTCVAYKGSCRAYVFESKPWLETLNLNTLDSWFHRPIKFLYRAQELDDEIPVFKGACHVFSLGTGDRDEVFELSRRILFDLMARWRQYNPLPVLEVPIVKGNYSVWLPATLTERFNTEFEDLLRRFAGAYGISIPWKFKEAKKKKEKEE